MWRLIMVCSIGIVIFGCTPKEVIQVQTFSPKMVDMVKLYEKNYEEIVGVVNDNYAPKTREFNDARLLKEEKMFLYYHVYTGRSTACYRVTVDSNRSKIINIQPDCPIED